MKIAMKTTRRAPPYKGFIDRPLMDRLADIAVKENVEFILRKARFTGEPQRENAPSTYQRKARAGRARLPVVDKLRRFVTKQTYLKVISQVGPGKWRARIAVANYQNTVAILGYLAEKGYTDILGLTQTAKAKIAEELQHAVGRFTAGQARGAVNRVMKAQWAAR